MTLDSLASDIDAAAKEEAKAIIDAAKAKAQDTIAEAKREGQALRSDMIAKARRERSQIMTETVASARQANQKSMLIARKEELDATKDSASEMVGSANLKGRSDLLKSLFVEAKRDGGKKKGKGMVMRPVGIDRSALEDAGDDFEFGDDIDGLGGFVLEKRDGSVILDYRFDGRFEKSWVTALPMVTSVLFGDE